MVGFGACFPAVAGPGLAEQPADDDDRLDQLPTPAEVVDSVFDFAAQLPNAQRDRRIGP